MSTLHVDTLIRLGEQFAHAVATLAAHRKDFDRADQLVDHLSLCGVPAVAVPPSWPLTAYAPLIVVNSTGHSTIPIGLTSFQGQNGTEWNFLMAGAAISMVPGLALTLLLQKYIFKGIAISSGFGGR